MAKQDDSLSFPSKSELSESATAHGKKRKVLLGRYEVIRALGRGGMGKVFLVYDRVSQEKRALEMLRTAWQENDRVIARFRREIETLQKLDHPLILKLHEVHEEEGRFFYTMEYVRGKSVRDWIRQRGQLQFGSVVRVLCMMARALEYAHAITIHRDISPDNVMVMSDGSIRLLDFGLAKLEDQNQNLTMIGVNMGKIQYNAPEQRVNAASVDHRADLYPLGVMFYEMLTGQRPKDGLSLTELRPDLPASCDAFYEKATAARPEDRHASAKDLHDHLLEVYRGWEKGDEPQTAAVADGKKRNGLSLWSRLRGWFSRGRESKGRGLDKDSQ